MQFFSGRLKVSFAGSVENVKRTAESNSEYLSVLEDSNTKFCAEHNSKRHLLKDMGLFKGKIILIHQLNIPFFSRMCILSACTRWQHRLQPRGRHFRLFHQ